MLLFWVINLSVVVVLGNQFECCGCFWVISLSAVEWMELLTSITPPNGRMQNHRVSSCHPLAASSQTGMPFSTTTKSSWITPRALPRP